MATRKRPGRGVDDGKYVIFLHRHYDWYHPDLYGSCSGRPGIERPSEMTAILLIAMTSISWLVRRKPTKGVMSTMFGILLASMGMNTLSGLQDMISETCIY